MLEKGAAATNDKTRAFWTYATGTSLIDQGRITVEATATDRFGRTASASADKTF